MACVISLASDLKETLFKMQVGVRGRFLQRECLALERHQLFASPRRRQNGLIVVWGVAGGFRTRDVFEYARNWQAKLTWASFLRAGAGSCELAMLSLY